MEASELFKGLHFTPCFFSFENFCQCLPVSPILLYTRIKLFNYDFFFICRNLVQNPFACNCHLAWFSEWLRGKGLSGSTPRCETPLKLKDIPIKDIPQHDFKCTSKLINFYYLIY